MGVSTSSRLKGLEESFQTFNQLTQSLETTYHDLEDRVVELHCQFEKLQHTQSPDLQPPTETHLANVLNVLPAGVVVLDDKGTVQHCNAASLELLGEPLLGQAWRDIVARSFAPQNDDGHEISLRNGRRVSLKTCPLGEQPGQVLLLTDVTDTRQLQERLSQYKRLTALGEMAASLAHQVRTPLSAAILSSSQLKNNKLEAATRNTKVDKLLGHLRQLENLVNDMLLYSRNGYAGEEPFSTAELLEFLIPQVELQVNQSEINFMLTDECGPSKLIGNRHMLQSAIQNLITNAIQAMQGRGNIELSLSTPALNSIDIKIVDDGPGIAKEIQDKIFDPFYTTRSNGTGLGLAVVRAIVRAHRGEVWLESNKGEGCTFILRLPTID
ncbi:sensor histidine kinase [Kaarinaea lacus]